METKQPSDESPDRSWRPPNRVAQAAALLSVVFFPIQIIVFILNPLPNTVLGWFALFQKGPLIGHISETTKEGKNSTINCQKAGRC